MKLTKRLESLVDLIPSDVNYIADIGADHGYVAKFILDNYKVKVFASDNKLGPFNRLKKNLQNYKNVKLSLSDGLNELDNDVDMVLISGMGGNLIINILKENEKHLAHLNYLLLSPHNDAYELRKYVISKGYMIANESFIVDDGKYYSHILFKKGQQNYNDLELKYGPYILNEHNEDFIAYLNEMKMHYEFLLKKYNLTEKRKKDVLLQLEEIKNL